MLYFGNEALKRSTKMCIEINVLCLELCEKDLLYGELASGKRPSSATFHGCVRARPEGNRHRHQYMGSLHTRHGPPGGRLRSGLISFEERQQLFAEEKQDRRKIRLQADRPATVFVCEQCQRDCHSRVGLYSHNS